MSILTSFTDIYICNEGLVLEVKACIVNVLSWATAVLMNKIFYRISNVKLQLTRVMKKTLNP